MPPTSTPPPGSDAPPGRTWPPELLTAAVERAVRVARDDARTRGAPPPPVPLRPFVGFTKLPGRAVRTVLETLERDEAFRARVAEGAEESALGRSSWLFLTRPEGWQQDLAALAEQADEERHDTEAARRELSAQRRAEQLDVTVDRLRDELAERRDELAEAERDAARERAARAGLEAERDELSARLGAAEDERARAVRELKATEATSTARLEELRAERDRVAALERRVQQLEADLAGVAAPEPAGTPAQDAPSGPSPAREPSPSPGPWDGADPAAVAAAIDAAARAAAQLGRALSQAAAGLGAAGSGAGVAASLSGTASPRGTAPPPDPGPATGAGGQAPRPPRRVPVRLRGGVHDGSADGLAQLLGVDGLVAIVDGYNVSMEGWPALGRSDQRTSLVRALGAVQSRVVATLHVVFDGDADGRRPSVAAPLPVRVHFSPEHTEADDVILEMVASLPTDTPVAVVSSDRRVADGARRLGANAVRSSVLLELLRR